MSVDLNKPGLLIRAVDGRLYFIPDDRLGPFGLPPDQTQAINKLNLHGPTRAVPASMLGPRIVQSVMPGEHHAVTPTAPFSPTIAFIDLAAIRRG